MWLCAVLWLGSCGRPLTGPEVDFIEAVQGPGFDPTPVRLYDDLALAAPRTIPARPRLTCQERIYPPPSGPTIRVQTQAMTIFQAVHFSPGVYATDFVSGWPDRLPAGPFLAYTDATSPRLTAAMILAALDWRERTGEGVSLDFSQAEGGVHFLAEAMVDQAVNGYGQTRMGNADRWMAPHSVYPCGEAGADQWVAIACETDQQWATLASVIGRADLAGLGAAERLAGQVELDELLAAWTHGRDPLAIQEQLQAAGVPAHQVQNSPEMIADPQLLFRDHFHQVPHEMYGHTWAEQFGFRLSRSDGTPSRPGPMWGEHNYQILSEVLGYDSDKIAELVIAGVLE